MTTAELSKRDTYCRVVERRVIPSQMALREAIDLAAEFHIEVRQIQRSGSLLFEFPDRTVRVDSMRKDTPRSVITGFRRFVEKRV